MNAKVFFKVLLATGIVALLVMVGMNNRETIRFTLPPLLPAVKQPAALMYVGFFGFGLLAGTLITSGGGKKGGGSSAQKSAKAGR